MPITFLDFRKNGSLGNVFRVKLYDSTSTNGAAGLTGLSNGSSGLVISTIADVEAAVTFYSQGGATIDPVTVLGTFSQPTLGHARFSQVDATHNPGVYEIQLADTRFAVTGAKSLLVSIFGATNLAQADFLIRLTSLDHDLSFSANVDAVSTVPPAGMAGTFREMLVQTWRRFFKQSTNDTIAGNIKTYADDNATVLTTQSVATVGSVTTVGKAG